MKRLKGGVTRALGGSSKAVLFSLSGEQRLGSSKERQVHLKKKKLRAFKL